MYTDPSAPRSGLGQYPVTAYVAGGGDTHPCADYMFKLMNREACARMGYNGVTTAPAPVAPAPVAPAPVEPTTIVYGPPEPAEPLQPIIQTFDVDPLGAVVGGGGGSTTVFELVPGDPSTLFDTGGDLTVDVDATSRGFGLVEAMIAAGLAFLLFRAYQ